MDFIKKHYEKMILGLVLIGLVGVLVLMWFVIMADKQKMEDFKNNVVHSKGKPLPDLDLSRQDAVLNRLKQPYQLDFSATNKLFNPVQWRRGPDGKLIKLNTGREMGPGAAVVTKITPLYYVISLNSADTNGIAPRYKITVEHQAAPAQSQRRPQAHYASVNDKIPGLFTLQGVTGPVEDPTSIVLKMADGQTMTVEKDKPHRVVEGYSADIRYDVGEKINAPGQRIGDHLSFAGDDYNIIAIEQNRVVLLAQSNQKQYILPYRP